ncbi:MAG: hypothetical protein QW175_01130 [Candidatus Bathyarchaeia archaeon]
MWGIFTEGYVRKIVRERLAEFLGVPGAQFPIKEAITRRLGK